MKKALSLLLAVLMLVSLFSGMAFADDDVMVRFVLMVFEILQMDGEDAFRPAFDGFDGVEIGVLRPGGVEAEADAFGRVLEDEIEHGLRTEPMPAAVVVDGEADVVFRR